METKLPYEILERLEGPALESLLQRYTLNFGHRVYRHIKSEELYYARNASVMNHPDKNATVGILYHPATEVENTIIAGHGKRIYEPKQYTFNPFITHVKDLADFQSKFSFVGRLFSLQGDSE